MLVRLRRIQVDLAHYLLFPLVVGSLCWQAPVLAENLTKPSTLAGDEGQNKKAAEPTTGRGAEVVAAGRDLVNMDFPEPTDIKDIIKAVAFWTGKNVILDRNVNGKVQIISPRKVTKEEAYQAFLSALNVLDLTTVETGQVIKIMRSREAMRGNLQTFIGSNWAPRTDKIITQIIPLKYVNAKTITTTLNRIVSANALVTYEPTNTLIVSDSGYKVRRVLRILELLDVQTQQPKIMIVPIKNSDPKSVADRVNEILKASSVGTNKSNYNSFKIYPDDRTNSVIVFGPPRTIKDVKEMVQKFDIPADDPTAHSTIHVRPLDYADAKKLAATLSSLTQSNSSSRFRRPPVRTPGKSADRALSIADLGDGVKITADESANSLLITGSRAAYNALNSIVRKLDVRKSQVFIETDILDVSENDGFNYNLSIFGGKQLSGNKTVVGWEAGKMAPLIVAGSDAGQSSGASTQNAKSVADALSKNFTIGILAGQSVNVPGLGSFTPGGLIELIKTDANARVLSSPHILTSNHDEASITVGETIFIPNSTVNPQTGVSVPNLQKENVDLNVTIKPDISTTNYVTMKIAIQSNSIKSITNGRPNLEKRKTTQLVTVKNGQTIVISGLATNVERESFQKIPLLGDIPLIGRIFQNTQMSSSRSNLLIFITPHVIHGPADLSAIYKRKVADQNRFFETIYGKSYKQNSFYKNLPEHNGADFDSNELEEERPTEEVLDNKVSMKNSNSLNPQSSSKTNERLARMNSVE